MVINEPLHSGKASLATPWVAELRARFTDRLIAPNDSRYDQARTVFNGGIDRHPAAIIRVLDESEVARVVTFARQNGIELAVRSGGHSPAGHSVSEGGIVIDLSLMKALQTDIEGRTTWAETGMTAGEYTNALTSHNLVTGMGDTGSVGIGGLTLGGGVGYLVRKHGLTIDNLLGARVVTAGGQILHVDDRSHPDLFWAIRGGGGNFGVATSFHYRLHEVSSVVGGLLILPATPAVIAGFIAEAEAAPDELSTIVNIMVAPPAPFLPKEVYGKLIVMAMLIYAGAVEASTAVLAPFRTLATPLADLVRPMHYSEIYQAEAPDPHQTGVSQMMFLDTVDRPAAETILEHLHASTASMAITQLRVLGGAMARVPSDATAFVHRRSRIMANLIALYKKSEEKADHEDWVAHFAAALRQSDEGTYVNFLGDEGQERVRAAYSGATWDRLAAIKARYDPTNLFHLNQNIPPKTQLLQE